jgi:hypothetical protein
MSIGGFVVPEKRDKKRAGVAPDNPARPNVAPYRNKETYAKCTQR